MSHQSKQPELLAEAVVSMKTHLRMSEANVVMPGKVGSSFQPSSCTMRLCIRPMQQHQLNSPASNVPVMNLQVPIRIIKLLAVPAVLWVSASMQQHQFDLPANPDLFMHSHNAKSATST